MMTKEAKVMPEEQSTEYETYELGAFDKEMVEDAIKETIYRKLTEAMNKYDSFTFVWRKRPETREEDGMFKTRCRFRIHGS
jgi:hypothetical protein